MSGKMLGGTEGSGIDVSFLFFFSLGAAKSMAYREVSWRSPGGEVNDSMEQGVNLIN